MSARAYVQTAVAAAKRAAAVAATAAAALNMHDASALWEVLLQ